ncbi:MAG: DsbE family thiol:disulfide interchange protein [Achromobacter pulmonis]|uniref:Thiol:disulfide interchange protein DsbE n=1 Tax=Achromobacter pulmonis TaxID=1389932 RepID=A0A6S7D548_9BURK|nr:DsbE family thiol:disulfide interchange protein [Achromobacter pulmonis]MCF7771023.1 DsbE family thiol:disulfide interchange protein [Achromobacter pulmonis]MPT26470.1 DsbE family thiol:disulfide interchange protein [Achromobacter sp.]CAB3631713.1 Thiol:disulfide interchange protein DsbE [Achromobacter pulmonis]CAB3879138.1 Thiol:disulfide interchange protein DsbE [Achromobacter pulmonis]
MKLRFLIPLLLFLGLTAMLAVGLGLDPRELPSPLLRQPAPPFTLARLDAPTRQFGLDDMRGQVWLLNVWASWCVACRAEHPVLLRAAREGRIAIVGLDYKDEDNAARAWLAALGDPYTATVVDPGGRLGIDYGVYGVPETFLIDARGVIRYKHVGPVTQDVLDNILMPRAREALNEP